MENLPDDVFVVFMCLMYLFQMLTNLYIVNLNSSVSRKLFLRKWRFLRANKKYSTSFSAQNMLFKKNTHHPLLAGRV